MSLWSEQSNHTAPWHPLPLWNIITHVQFAFSLYSSATIQKHIYKDLKDVSAISKDIFCWTLWCCLFTKLSYSLLSAMNQGQISRLCKIENLFHVLLSGEHFLLVYVTVTFWLHVGRHELIGSICCELGSPVHVHRIFTLFSTRKFAMVEFRKFTALIWQIAQISLPQNITMTHIFRGFKWKFESCSLL